MGCREIMERVIKVIRRIIKELEQCAWGWASFLLRGMGVCRLCVCPSDLNPKIKNEIPMRDPPWDPPIKEHGQNPEKACSRNPGTCFQPEKKAPAGVPSATSFEK